MSELPRWRVNAASFIGHSLEPEGAEVVYQPPKGGEVAENLSPLNEAAQAIVNEQKSEHPDKKAAKAPKAPKAPKDDGDKKDAGEPQKDAKDAPGDDGDKDKDIA